MAETTGTVDFIVGDETFKTWYKVLGDLKSSVRPLVLLHGGPGIPHIGLIRHDELYRSFSIPVVWYDQIGCGQSTHLAHKPQEFWTFELFMDELENLLNHLGIAGSFDVLGHSWGGILAAQWAVAGGARAHRHQQRTRHGAHVGRVLRAAFGAHAARCAGCDPKA